MFGYILEGCVLVRVKCTGTLCRGCVWMRMKCVYIM